MMEDLGKRLATHKDRTGNGSVVLPGKRGVGCVKLLCVTFLAMLILPVGCVASKSADTERSFLRRLCDTASDPNKKCMYLLLLASAEEHPKEALQEVVDVWNSTPKEPVYLREQLYDTMRTIVLWSGSPAILQFLVDFYPGDCLSELIPVTIGKFAVRYPETFFGLQNADQLLSIYPTNDYWSNLYQGETIVATFETYADSSEQRPNKKIARDFASQVRHGLEELKRSAK